MTKDPTERLREALEAAGLCLIPLVHGPAHGSEQDLRRISAVATRLFPHPDASGEGLMKLVHENGPIVLDFMGKRLAWRPLDYGTWTEFTNPPSPTVGDQQAELDAGMVEAVNIIEGVCDEMNLITSPMSDLAWIDRSEAQGLIRRLRKAQAAITALKPHLRQPVTDEVRERLLICHGELENIARSRSTNFATVDELVIANRRLFERLAGQEGE